METNWTHFVTQWLFDAWWLFSFSFYEVKDLSTSSCFWRDREHQQVFAYSLKSQNSGLLSLVLKDDSVACPRLCVKWLKIHTASHWKSRGYKTSHLNSHHSAFPSFHLAACGQHLQTAIKKHLARNKILVNDKNIERSPFWVIGN